MMAFVATPAQVILKSLPAPSSNAASVFGVGLAVNDSFCYDACGVLGNSCL